MKVKDLILELLQANFEADVKVISRNKLFDFTVNSLNEESKKESKFIGIALKENKKTIKIKN